MKKVGLKIVLIFCFFLIWGSIIAQETKIDEDEIEKLVGVFDGYIEELEAYNFKVIYELDEIETEDSYQFVMINKKVEIKYDLKADKLLGKSFEISFTIRVESELNDEGIEDFYEVYTIIDLKLID